MWWEINQSLYAARWPAKSWTTRGREEKWSISQIVCSAVIKCCSLNALQLWYLGQDQNLQWNPRLINRKKRSPKCIRKWILSTVNVEIQSHYEKNFRVFKLTVVEHKHPGFFPHVQDSTSNFPDFSSLLIWFLVAMEDWVDQWNTKTF